MTLWEFALQTWADGRVRPALLALQDGAEQCVPLLLWSLWLSEESFAVDDQTLANAARAALPWHIAAEELRSARRRLKEVGAKPGLPAMIESATVMAERSLLEQLEALTPPVLDPSPGGHDEHLSALIAAWGRPVAPELLDGLLAALDPDASVEESGNDRDPELTHLRGLLTGLKDEHVKLSAAVEMLEAAPLPDQLQVARMKRRKLALRDEIVAIEDQLTPDIIA